MKRFFLITLLLASYKSNFAQNVGVNNSGATPDVSAMLDIVALDKGLLIPRVTLTDINDAVTVPTPATSLMVYNTATAGVSPNDVSPGYYYNSGTTIAPVWVKFATGPNVAWLLLGNAGTTAGTNFIGTTDAVDLVVKTNNTEQVRVLSTGQVGIGIAAPSGGAKVDITSANEGLLIPRVALTALNSNAPIGPTITTSLMVYNTATSGAAPNGVYPGHYYWDGTKWVRQVDFIVERWVYPPVNITANTTFTITAFITGVTSSSTATVNLYGDWPTAPLVTIRHVEAMTGAVRFVIQNTSAVTSYLGMDFIITTIR